VQLLQDRADDFIVVARRRRTLGGCDRRVRDGDGVSPVAGAPGENEQNERETGDNTAAKLHGSLIRWGKNHGSMNEPQFRGPARAERPAAPDTPRSRCRWASA